MSKMPYKPRAGILEHFGRIDCADYAVELIHRMGLDLIALALVVVYSLERR